MFGKIGKWLFTASLIFIAGAAALNMGQKASRLIKKENELFAQASGQAINAVRAMSKEGQTFLSRAGEQQMTLLFTGTNADSSDADALMLVAIDLEGNGIRVLEFPRRTYVRRENSSVTQLHEIYAAAVTRAKNRGDSKEEAVRKGNIALKGFLKKNMGIVIDHYVSLNAEGLETVVDALGGITVNLPQAINFDDAEDNLHIHMAAGKQSLSGRQAAAFVRLDDPAVGGIHAPRRVLSALFMKIKSELSLSTALDLLRASMAYTVSDLALPDLIPLTKGMLSISKSQVKMTTLKTSPSADGSDCLLLDRAEAIRQLADCLFYQEGIDERHFDPKRVFTP